MRCCRSARSPLEWTELPDREPGPNELRIRVTACGVCRTDLHVVDGELPNPKTPIIPGHEIVGRVDAVGHRLSSSCAVDRHSD
jgi:propanol-preferring alcohol dehydrogenase